MAVIYDKTLPVADIGVSDWWEYFFAPYEEKDFVYFDDIPSIAGATIRIIITGIGGGVDAEAGRVVMGIEKVLGTTVDDVQSRILDFSRKDRDTFGNLTLIPRRTVRAVDFNFKVEPGGVYKVQQKFQELAAKPALFLANKDMAETMVFGVYTKFSTTINGYTITPCAASVEEF